MTNTGAQNEAKKFENVTEEEKDTSKSQNKTE